MTRPISKPKEKRTITRPVFCLAWVTIRRAGEVREGFERRDLRRVERSDAAVSALRCNVDNRGQQRDEEEDKATSQHCVPFLPGWVSRIRKSFYGKIVIYNLPVNITRIKRRSSGNKHSDGRHLRTYGGVESGSEEMQQTGCLVHCGVLFIRVVHRDQRGM